MKKILRFGLIFISALMLILLLCLGALWIWAGQNGSFEKTLFFAKKYVNIDYKNANGALRGNENDKNLATADEIIYRDDNGLDLKISKFKLHLNLNSIFTKKIIINDLAAEKITFIPAKSTSSEKSPAPESISLPINISIRGANIGEFAFDKYSIKDINVKSLNMGQDYSLENISLDFNGAKLHLGTSLKGNKPFDTNINAAISLPEKEDVLEVKGDIFPFNENLEIIKQINLNLEHFNAVNWQGVINQFTDFTLPKTNLAGEVALSDSLKIDVKNKSAGLWDKGYIPLDAIKANLKFKDDIINIENLILNTSGGNISATGDVDIKSFNPKSDAKLNEKHDNWKLDIFAEDLNLLEIDSRFKSDKNLKFLNLSANANIAAADNAIDFKVVSNASSNLDNVQFAPQINASGQFKDKVLKINEALVKVLDLDLNANGFYDFAKISGDLKANIKAPEFFSKIDGNISQTSGAGVIDFKISNTARFTKWLNTLPFINIPLNIDNGAINFNGKWNGGIDNANIDAGLDVAGLSINSDKKILVKNLNLKSNGKIDALKNNLQFSGAIDDKKVSLAVSPQILLGKDKISVNIDNISAKYDIWNLKNNNAINSIFQNDILDISAVGFELLKTNSQNNANKVAINLDKSNILLKNGNIQIKNKGSISGFPMAWIDDLFNNSIKKAGISGDIVFNGNWAADFDKNSLAKSNLDVKINRSSGDLIVNSDTAKVAANISAAEIFLAFKDGILNTNLNWASEYAGIINANLKSDVKNDDFMESKISGNINAKLPRIAAWSALAPLGWRVRGSLESDVQLGGSFAKPEAIGNLVVNNFSIRSIVDGVAFSDGVLKARFDRDKLILSELKVSGAKDNDGNDIGGSLSGLGFADFSDFKDSGVVAALDIKLNKLSPLMKEGRKITTSGNISAKVAGQNLKIDGDIKFDKADIISPENTAPALGSDVFIDNQKYDNVADAAGGNIDANKSSDNKNNKFKAEANVRVDLGDNFSLKGMGIDTKLKGILVLSSNNDKLSLNGLVQTAGGKFAAYGQKLDIKRGLITFNGNISNPILDILAVRPNYVSEQQAGVQVLGTAILPQVKLYSNPVLSESETLSWLLLGRAAPADGAEAAMLQTAALAMLGGKSGGGIASRFGLDDLSFSGGEDNSIATASVTLGKRLSNRLYAAYEYSVANAGSSVLLFYQLSRLWTIRAQAGGVVATDIIYRVSFD